MQRRDINAADAPAPAGQYTQAVEVTGSQPHALPQRAGRHCFRWQRPGRRRGAMCVGVAEFAGATARCRYGDRESGEDHHDRARFSRCRQSAGRPCGSAGHASAASTLIIGGLSNPAWKVEVEGIAVA